MLPELVRNFLDYLIPPNIKNSIGGASVWQHSIDRVEIEFFLHKFLSEEMSCDGMSLEQANNSLLSKHKVFYAELVDKLIQDYFSHECVKKEYNQNIPSPMPKGYALPITDWSILEPVVLNPDNASRFFRES